MSRPQTLLVTGVNGQVGNALLKTLAPFGTVVPVDVIAGDVQIPGLKLVDFTNVDALARLVRDVKPTIIINPAAYTAVDKAESEKATAAAVNATAAGILATEAKRLGAPIIHYSTDYVFDGSGTAPRKEDAATGPLGVYGQTKLDGEHAVRDANDAYVILRTSWVFSAHGANFVKTMLRLGKDREELKVVADQYGAPTSAAMLAEATAKVVALGLKNGFSSIAGLYHLTCLGETSWHGFATEIFRQAREHGMPLKVTRVDPIDTASYPTPATRPLNSRLDCNKFMRTFGQQIPSWQEALAVVMATLASSDCQS